MEVHFMSQFNQLLIYEQVNFITRNNGLKTHEKEHSVADRRK